MPAHRRRGCERPLRGRGLPPARPAAVHAHLVALRPAHIARRYLRAVRPVQTAYITPGWSPAACSPALRPGSLIRAALDSSSSARLPACGWGASASASSRPARATLDLHLLPGVVFGGDAIMAFQPTPRRSICGASSPRSAWGLEQITIDTFLPELVPPRHRGRAFAYYQFIEFCIVPVVALLGWLRCRMIPLGWPAGAGLPSSAPSEHLQRGGCDCPCRRVRAGSRCVAVTSRPKRSCRRSKRV